MGITWQSGALHSWESHVTEKRKGGCNNRPLNLGRPSSDLQCPSRCSDPRFCSPAEPRLWHGPTRGGSKVKVGLIWVLEQRAFPAVEPGLPLCSASKVAESWPRPPLRLLTYWPLLTRKPAGEHLGEAAWTGLCCLSVQGS